MIQNILIFIGISILIPALIAGGMILSERPEPLAGDGLDFSRIKDTVDPVPMQTVAMRDGWQMPVRRLDGPTDRPLIVLVHGSGWHGRQFEPLMRAIEGEATLIAPDLRGHGVAPTRRGDIDHIGQFEEDLADLIAASRQPGQKVIVAGHSSGGGLVVRMAGGAHGGAMDHAVLMAPFLKYNAPTARTNSGGWANVATRRVIGLTMLNAVRIRALNHLPVIAFNFPASVLNGPLGATATPAYSYRLNTSYAPRSAYLDDIAALPAFDLIAGTDDEAFVAAAYQPTIEPVNPRGRYHLIPGIGHLDIVTAPETIDILRGLARGS